MRRALFASLAASALAYATLNCTGNDPDLESAPRDDASGSDGNVVDPTNDGGGSDGEGSDGNDGAPPTPEGAFSWSFLAGPPQTGAVPVAVDGAGNVFFAVRFNGANAAFGDKTLSSAARDVAVVRLSPNGKTVDWAVLITGPGNEEVTGITIDANNDVYVSGTFDGATMSASGTPSVNRGTLAVANAFVAKLSGATGAGQWVTPFTITAPDGGSSLGATGGPLRATSGGLWFACNFRGDIVLPSGTATLPDRNGTLLAKIDPSNGAVMPGWQTISSFNAGSNTLPGVEAVITNAIEADPSGNLYVSGQQNATQLRVGPSPINNAFRKGNSSGFVLGFGPSLASFPQWWKIFGPSSAATGAAAVRAMKLDAARKAVYVTGTFSGESDFGYGNIKANDAGPANDVFVVRITSDVGTPEWQKAFGGESGDTAAAIDVDPWGRPFVSAYFQNVGTALIDGKPLPSGSVFAAVKLDPADGKALYVTARSSTDTVTAYGAAGAPNGHAIMSGSLLGSMTFEAPKSPDGGAIFIADLTP